ncbi:MAG: type I methionyl aminopeptidase, partial [Acinetobacter bohemicus]
KDHSLSAQYEHTLLVTKTGVEILNARPEEDLSRFMK